TTVLLCTSVHMPVESITSTTIELKFFSLIDLCRLKEHFIIGTCDNTKKICILILNSWQAVVKAVISST
ncbi:hypothetical protein ACJX0J_025669, partial [Zea mays]